MQMLLLVEYEGISYKFAINDSALPLLNAREAAKRLRSGESDRIKISSESLLQLWLTPHRNAIDGMVYNHLSKAIAVLADAQHIAIRPGATLTLTIQERSSVSLLSTRHPQENL